MRRYALLALTTSLLGHPITMLAQQDLDIGMTLSKTVVMLGEPVWIEVTVTNKSGQELFLDFGNVCFGNKPLGVSVPDAESTKQPATRCGASLYGSCPSGALPSLGDRETMTRRYVFDGDFHIVHPGSYNVLLEKTIRYAPVSSNRSGLQLPPSLEKQQTAKSELLLQVDASDAGKLLAIEQEYAETLKKNRFEAKFPALSADGKPYDTATVKLAEDRLHAAQAEELIRRSATAE